MDFRGCAEIEMEKRFQFSVANVGMRKKSYVIFHSVRHVGSKPIELIKLPSHSLMHVFHREKLLKRWRA